MLGKISPPLLLDKKKLPLLLENSKLHCEFRTCSPPLLITHFAGFAYIFCAHKVIANAAEKEMQNLLITCRTSNLPKSYRKVRITSLDEGSLLHVLQLLPEGRERSPTYPEPNRALQLMKRRTSALSAVPSRITLLLGSSAALTIGAVVFLTQREFAIRVLFHRGKFLESYRSSILANLRLI